MSSSPIGTSIDRALEILRNGGVIGFPTETVYGLAADASNSVAINRIFDIKGRPRNHPLIVHLDSLAEARLWSADWSASAEILGALFWPGPLTVIVTKALTVHLEVTGGLETLALRVPNHAVALEVLRGLEGGIAAPSANKFGKVSPTTAEHVLADLGSEVDYILDGGPCSIGLESTIVDCSTHHSDSPSRWYFARVDFSGPACIRTHDWSKSCSRNVGIPLCTDMSFDRRR